MSTAASPSFLFPVSRHSPTHTSLYDDTRLAAVPGCHLTSLLPYTSSDEAAAIHDHPRQTSSTRALRRAITNALCANRKRIVSSDARPLNRAHARLSVATKRFRVRISGQNGSFKPRPLRCPCGTQCAFKHFETNQYTTYSHQPSRPCTSQRCRPMVEIREIWSGMDLLCAGTHRVRRGGARLALLAGQDPSGHL